MVGGQITMEGNGAQSGLLVFWNKNRKCSCSSDNLNSKEIQGSIFWTDINMPKYWPLKKGKQTQNESTGYVPIHCYRICANTLLQDMCQHHATGYVPTSYYRICANTSLQDVLTSCYRMCQHLTTGYVPTPCYRIHAKTSLQDMC